MFDIKVGFLVSYDYKYIYHSLPPVYAKADQIVLAIDKSRLTWSGIPFTIDASFFNWIAEIDTKNKITIYEDDFYQPELSTVECDTRERNMIASKLGDGGWHIQIDSDEYFLDFNGFVNYLRTLEKEASIRALHVYTQFITLYKKLEKGFLAVDGKYERIATATNFPKYNYIRTVDNIKRIHSNFLVVHQSWARPEEEISLKLKSWGHLNDFNVDSYFKIWKAVDENNYAFFHNFHPLSSKTWPGLVYIDKNEITDVLDYIRKHKTPVNYGPPPIFTRVIRKIISILNLLISDHSSRN